MNLNLSMNSVVGYTSHAQMARVLTETWMRENMYCPNCGHPTLGQFQNNQPVADFYCSACGAQYELKSKKEKIGKKINDGAYHTMIQRITSNENPDLFVMSYSLDQCMVKNLLMIPKFLFTPDIIEKRKPLADHAQRAGWVGCNILLDKIPEQGRIAIIKDGTACERTAVVDKVRLMAGLRVKNMEARGWLVDVLSCVNDIPAQEFTLEQMYQYEQALSQKHPDNNNIRPKIRQQLQVLRDKSFIQFIDKGVYRKV
ncbi:MAG: DpnI domain-containing protein [Peptococcaceae bacterium]|nr:DpnI domain-containing protein [Peptococcaceae bacterium]